MLPLDTIAHANRLRGRHPVEKVVFSAGLMAACLLLPPWPASGLAWLTTTAGALLVARVPPRALLRASAIPAAFLAAGALPLVLRLRPGGAGGPMLSVGEGGAVAALAASLRAMGALSCLLFLAMTTPLPELLRLARRCRVPAALVETALVTYDMVSVLLAACRDLRIAQGSRLGYATTRSAFRSQALLWSSLLVKSLARARRLEVGLASRGFTGELRVLSRAAPPSAAGLLAAAGPVALVVLLSLLVA